VHEEVMGFDVFGEWHFSEIKSGTQHDESPCKG
jgi:hypothetical protein